MKKLLFTALLLNISIIGLAQEEPTGGVVTGEAKVYTSKRTVGIIDQKAPKVFDNVTAQTVLKDFQCVSGGKEKEYIIETTSCVVAVFDYDNDGKPDIFLLNGSTINAKLKVINNHKFSLTNLLIK